MTIVSAGLSTSIDGFVADADGDYMMLYADAGTPEWDEYLAVDIASTGAAVIGRTMFDLMPEPDMYADGYEYQVPIFVVTHEAPEHVPAANDRLSITYVTDGVASAVAQARAAAGDGDVKVLGGADLTDQVVALGLADQVTVDVMPVVLGSGRRFLDGVDRRIDLTLVDATRYGQRTCLRFAVGSTNEPTA